MKKVCRKLKAMALLIIILSLCMCSKKNPNPETEPETITDIDGNTYNVVKIGNQTWMAENLNVTHYNNGDAIENIQGDLWDDQTLGAYCIYNNDETIGNSYGLLYNWYAVVDNRNLCPDGWHIPSYSEWELLGASGLEHKEQGIEHWFSPNNCLPDFSDFNGLPGGNSGSNGTTAGLGQYGYWWTSSEDSHIYAWLCFMANESMGLGGWINMDKWMGASVRCIKD